MEATRMMDVVRIPNRMTVHLEKTVWIKGEDN